MTATFDSLTFAPNINEIVPPGTSGARVILTGTNNSGKSAYLRQAIDHPTKLFMGVSRLYSLHYLTLYNEEVIENEAANIFGNFQNAENRFQNYEGSNFDLNNALTRLTDDRRTVLFKTFTNLFCQEIEVRAKTQDNEFSHRYVSVDGDSLGVTSSGTRLFLGLLAALMDERFNLIAIDEPELGLSPPLQRRLSEVIMKPELSDTLFPHRPNILLGTHSHVFLDKSKPENNWIVSRCGKEISARRCNGFSELHDIQFRLLGNDLKELYLPHAVVFVEGETDKMYLDQVFRFRLPDMKIVTQNCGGDIAERLSYWAETIDIQTSPYRNRTFAVYDKAEQGGFDRVCRRLGFPDSNKIKWSKNGIEYVYPLEILKQIYQDTRASADSLKIENDRVSYDTISYTKKELCKLVCNRLSDSTKYPDELENKLLSVLCDLQN